MLRREKLVFSTPEWKNIPWQEIPKDLKDVLVDVLVDMPGLLEDLDDMQSCRKQSRQRKLRHELVQRCWEHERQLLDWLHLVCQELGSSTHASATEPGEKDLVTHLAVIHGMSLFWTTCIILYSTLRTASGPQAELPGRTDPMHYVRKLAEAISSLLRPSAGLYGKQSAALPLELALLYITDTFPLSEENETLLKTLTTLRDSLHGDLPPTIS